MPRTRRSLLAAVAAFFLPGVCTYYRAASSPFQPIYSWTTVDYKFPKASDRIAQLNDGSYKPRNIAIVDVDFWPWDEHQRMFVTTPSFQTGTPATLSTVSAHGYGGKPLLSPYPDWDWHRPGVCYGITSAHRIKIDKCGRLWVLDSGTVDMFTNATRICQPQVLVFDLATDYLVKRFKIPEDYLSPDSLLVNLELDCRDPTRCYDTFVYIADSGANRLLVLDSTTGSVWQVESNYFYPNPLDGIFQSLNGTLSLMLGVTPMALSPVYSDNDRLLFFHGLSSIRESCVKASLLRDSSLFQKDHQSCRPESFLISQPILSSQAVSEVITENGIMFYDKMQNGIGCWNSNLPYVKENLVALPYDKEFLEVQIGIKAYNRYLLVLSTNQITYLNDEHEKDKVNFRVLIAHIPSLTKGTSCHY